MEDQLADGELESICFKLDFRYFFDRTIKWRGETRTLYSVIKQWLWEKHKILPFYDIGEFNVGKWYFWLSGATYSDNSCLRSEEEFDSPIMAEIWAIRKAVEYIQEEEKLS